MEIFSLRANESIDTIFALLEPPQRFRINSIGNIINATILFGNSYDNGTGLGEEFGGPVTNITEALDNNFLPCNTWFNTKFCCHFSIIKDLSSRVEHT